MWTRDLTPIDMAYLDADQEEVEGEWGADFYDARTHSLYPWFRQHLVDSPGWAILDQIDDRLSAHIGEYRRAFDRFQRKVGRRLPGLPDWDVDAMVSSVLGDGHNRQVSGWRGIDFKYERQREIEGDKVSWYLSLGNWRVGGADDQQLLDLAANVHSSMVKAVATDPALAELWRIGKRTQEMVSDFRAALGSPATLDRQVEEGVCGACRDMVKVAGVLATRQLSVRAGKRYEAPL